MKKYRHEMTDQENELLIKLCVKLGKYIAEIKMSNRKTKFSLDEIYDTKVDLIEQSTSDIAYVAMLEAIPRKYLPREL